MPHSIIDHMQEVTEEKGVVSLLTKTGVTEHAIMVIERIEEGELQVRVCDFRALGSLEFCGLAAHGQASPIQNATVIAASVISHHVVEGQVNVVTFGAITRAALFTRLGIGEEDTTRCSHELVYHDPDGKDMAQLLRKIYDEKNRRVAVPKFTIAGSRHIFSEIKSKVFQYGEIHNCTTWAQARLYDVGINVINPFAACCIDPSWIATPSNHIGPRCLIM